MGRLAALALAVGCFVIAGAGHAASTDDRVIKVLAKTTTAKLQDKPPKGDSPGDVVIGSDLLRNAAAQFGKAKGAIVGRDRWRMVYKSATTTSVSVTVTLPGGTVSCRGTLRNTDKVVVIRVFGGTGVFSGATGTCSSRAAANEQSLNVYRLSLP